MITWIGSVALAAVVSFVIGAVWYSVLFGESRAALRPGFAAPVADTPSAAVMALEFARCLIVATALGWLVSRSGIATLPDALILAVVVWGGFQVMGLIGSVLHEGYPPGLYAVHMGDALAKLTASSLIITGLTSRFA